MPFLIEAVEAYATIGEICGALREVFGEFKQVKTG
jgi:methylmalonyl-CoA mutase N-terminal domain/subunit